MLELNRSAAERQSDAQHGANHLHLVFVALTSLIAIAAAQGANAQVPDPAPAAQAAPSDPVTDAKSDAKTDAKPDAKSEVSSIEDVIKKHEQELEQARNRQRDAIEAENKLKAEIASIGQDRNKLNQQLIDVAGRVRAVEGRIADSENRLRTLDTRETTIRNSLDARRAETTEVLAALQRAGRRAPPALMVRPEDALQSLRTAMLLGAVVPEMRARAERLIADLGNLVSIRKEAGEQKNRLLADRDSLTNDQRRLAALIEERQRQQASAEKDMEAERSRAAELSKEADNLRDLIAKMEQDLKSAAKAAAAAKLAEAAKANAKSNAKDPGRLTPAIAFASAKGLLPMPVNGPKIRSFGSSDGTGGVERGISVAARAGAQVTTPCDGWVVYSGPFRSYGQLLILNAGGGYHVLLAGMERISVNIGQFVLTGEPVGTMGTASQVASMLAAAPSQPVLYIEFRKDNAPIDPGPWWAASEGEKVRG
ncbi:peptidoglycan DD-metalloendopeptidase family protein [Bradyrhizobium sp. LHD-71]|uniref:murein hydrolase activator EnvC family protein n=1 Tax=Bradyrhizobium sp. LHD-71 TaxID=3072141 RepID=UPI00280D300A|nr:peptidoglycan DD-metalloendopeptidase family protein [Bradyrhizobium sp. LHD-71]MDQ8729526.1 peptidoglycan DD-metalloendopeptidase family protein [Bradyrhizobium sp. LHD-71]